MGDFRGAVLVSGFGRRRFWWAAVLVGGFEGDFRGAVKWATILGAILTVLSDLVSDLGERF